jgi:hypothetical protein
MMGVARLAQVNIRVIRLILNPMVMGDDHSGSFTSIVLIGMASGFHDFNRNRCRGPVKMRPEASTGW